MKTVSFALLLHLKFGLKLLPAYKATRLHEIKSWQLFSVSSGAPAPRPTNEYSAEARGGTSSLARTALSSPNRTSERPLQT
jgi:hypothetical protein